MIALNFCEYANDTDRSRFNVVDDLLELFPQNGNNYPHRGLYLVGYSVTAHPYSRKNETVISWRKWQPWYVLRHYLFISVGDIWPAIFSRDVRESWDMEQD